MAEIRYVEVDGVRLRASIRGAVRPLLLTGIGASLGLSAPFEDALHPHGVQTIAVDAPLCVPTTTSASCDQAILVDHANASLSSYAVSFKIDRFG